MDRRQWKLWGLNIDKVSYIHGHFVDLRGVVLLDIAQYANVVSFDKIDGHTFPTKTTGSTNSVEQNEVSESVFCCGAGTNLWIYNSRLFGKS